MIDGSRLSSFGNPSDPKLAHLDGLNLSRAWMLEGIAAIDLRFFPSLRLHPEFVRSVLAGGHDESRTGTEGFVGIGGVDLFAWCLPADDVSMAERVALAA
jgi:hypothetical protein